MPILPTDMSQVASPGEVPDEGWYRVRISKVELGESKTGNQIVNLQLKIQDEGAFFGRVIFDVASLQSHALFKLKGYYNAVGYKPGPEGHDPDRLLDGEVYVYAEHEVYEGVVRAKVPPWSIKSLTEGPGRKQPKAS